MCFTINSAIFCWPQSTLIRWCSTLELLNRKKFRWFSGQAVFRSGGFQVRRFQVRRCSGSGCFFVLWLSYRHSEKTWNVKSSRAWCSNILTINHLYNLTVKQLHISVILQSLPRILTKYLIWYCPISSSVSIGHTDYRRLQTIAGDYRRLHTCRLRRGRSTLLACIIGIRPAPLGLFTGWSHTQY